MIYGDDGALTNIYYDVAEAQTWETQILTNAPPPNGTELDQQRLNLDGYDAGTAGYITIDYDWEGAETWATWTREYDAAGALTNETFA